MRPPKTNHSQCDLFRSRLSSLIDPKHPLKVLADRIDWTYFEKEFGAYYKPMRGQPPRPIRLMVGLLMLQHIFKESDDQVVKKWAENPYWQYFCGFDYLEWQEPINPSSLTRFRQRLGEEGVKKILQATIKEILADKGYRGHGIKDKKVLIPGKTKTISRYKRKQLRQRSAIEARISHMKNQGKLGRNFLKGTEGDAINALLCAIGQNMRQLMAHNYLIIAFFRPFLYLFIQNIQEYRAKWKNKFCTNLA